MHQRLWVVRMKTFYAWLPRHTDKGWRWLESVGVRTSTEERELYPWYPGDFEPPTFQATVKHYVCLRGQENNQ